MSVDPDDLTPGAIRESGAKVITYGVPVQPGNMFMLAYLEINANRYTRSFLCINKIQF